MTASPPGRIRRAAHFLLVPELLDSPPNRAIIEALLASGHEVHVFAPGQAPDGAVYGPAVHGHRADDTFCWLLRNLGDPRW